MPLRLDRGVDVDGAVVVVQDADLGVAGVAEQAGTVEVEGVGAERPVHVLPGSRGVQSIEVRAGAGERVSTVLLLVGPLRDLDVGLIGGAASFYRIHVHILTQAGPFRPGGRRRGPAA